MPETGTPAPLPERHHDHGEGPPLWMTLMALSFIAGAAWLYQAYLGDLAGSAYATGQTLLPRLLLAAGVLLVAFVAAGFLRMGLRHSIEAARQRRALGALLRYGLYIVALLVAVSVLAPGQLSGLLVGLGLVGFGLTLALQTPILGMVGWLTVNVQGLYSVGDRISVGEVRGDVLHVGLLTTVLWEIEGELGRPTGRRVSFGNQLVLEQPVVNYSADLPYNWNMLHIPVAKEADWDLARRILLEAADEVIGNERMAARVREYETTMAAHDLRYQLPSQPTVSLKLAEDHSYVDMRLRYLVHLDEQGVVRTRLLQRIHEEFRKHPRRLPVVYTRNQQQALDRHGFPANAWGPEDMPVQEDPDEADHRAAEAEQVEAVPKDR